MVINICNGETTQKGSISKLKTISESEVKIIQNNAKQGDAIAQYNLGVMYANGRGAIQNDKQAAHWYELAAKQGDAMAQNNLGVMYDNGQGVIQNDKQAVYWYELAAKQGDAMAQYNLGVMYANGQGVLKDYKLANMWALLAKYNGNTSNGLSSFLDKKMSQQQKESSQEMAQTCLNSKYLKCI